MDQRLWCGAIVCALTGCTGLTLGENAAGSDTYLGAGDIAVDDRTETSFVVEGTQTRADWANERTKQTLYAVDPDDGAVRTVEDLTGREDLRILFPSSGVLLMSEENDEDVLELRDKDTLSSIKTARPGVRYHGTRMSPSRNWVAVADNTSDKAPIHILDTKTLKPKILPHDGDWLEAMWMHESDRLVAIVFYGMDTNTPSARILRWSMDAVAASGLEPDSSGLWPNRELDIALPGVTADLAFSFTWVGVSPDDRYVVFPVRKVEKDQPDSYELIVLDTTDGSTRAVPDAKGPVGFTPDGATIVSYAGDEQQTLLLVDTKTLTKDPVPVTMDGGISFFVSHEGNQIVAAGSLGDQRLVLYDVDSRKQTRMAGPAVGLYELVSRLGHDEMWLVDRQSLFRMDMNAATFETVDTTFAPEHINLLPTRDRLVLDGAGTRDLFFFDPEKRKVTRKVTLE